MRSGGFGSSYKRRAAEQQRKVLAVLIVIAMLCGFFYWWGGEVVRSSEVAYKQQAIQKQKQLETMEKAVTDLQAQVQSTQTRYQQLEKKYMAEVPQGQFRELTDLVRQQLDAGIKSKRLAFAIESARPPRNCSAPKNKRFVVKTPTYNGPHGAVSFANGAITVTGDGASAVNEKGKEEAWYDPGKPVKVKFIEIGGKETVKEGLLPLQHSMVLRGREYRFTIAAGARSFIAVTGDNCDYP